MTTIAFSYIRFSSVKQERGDSLRRQTTGSTEYARKKGYTLDTSLTLNDLGVSAFRGANVREGALGGFLHAVREGRVPKGSVLIVESLDRLTRDELSEALNLFLDILRAGVKIATLTPEREYSKASINDIGSLIEPLIIFVRAHEESKTKSDRLTKAWAAKRNKLNSSILTAACPMWCRPKEDRSGFDLIPERAEVVRQIFRWASDGQGVNSITKKLNEKFPPIGRKPEWHRSYVLKILKNKAVLGEYQPHRGHVGTERKPVGKPIEDYFPAVIDQGLWYRVQSALKSRKTMGGRKGEGVTNLFTGLLHDARDKGALNIVDKGQGKQLVSSKAMRGVKGSKYLAFDYALFETAFLEFVKELKPADLSPPKPTKQEDIVAELTGKYDELTGKVEKIKKKIAENPEIDSLLDMLTSWELERKQLAKLIEEAKGKKHEKDNDALAEAKSIITMLSEASGEQKEELRSRLRQRIRQLVSQVFVVVWEEAVQWHPVDKKRQTMFRFIEVQVRLATGERRWWLMENSLKVFFAGEFAKSADPKTLNETDRQMATQFDLETYNGWYDGPMSTDAQNAWVWALRMFCREYVKATMQERSKDKSIEGIRCPTKKEREALKAIAEGKDGVHWRTAGSLLRRGWASRSSEKYTLTDNGWKVLQS